MEFANGDDIRKQPQACSQAPSSAFGGTMRDYLAVMYIFLNRLAHC